MYHRLPFSYITRTLPCLLLAVSMGATQAQTVKDARTQKKTTVNVVQGNRQSLIREASEGESDKVRRLLTQKFSQADKDAALLAACEQSIHRLTRRGTTWLKECERIVDLLLEAGANPNATNKKKETPLLLLSNRMPSAEQLLLLLKQGAQVNAADSNGLTALVYMVAANRTDMVRLLLENGAEPHVKVHGKTVSLLSIRVTDKVKPEIIELLQKAGATE